MGRLESDSGSRVGKGFMVGHNATVERWLFVCLEGDRCIDFPGMRIFIFIDSFMYSFCRITVCWQVVMNNKRASICYCEMKHFSTDENLG